MRNPTLGLRRDDPGTTCGAGSRTRRKTFDVLFRIANEPPLAARRLFSQATAVFSALLTSRACCLISTSIVFGGQSRFEISPRSYTRTRGCSRHTALKGFSCRVASFLPLLTL